MGNPAEGNRTKMKRKSRPKLPAAIPKEVLEDDRFKDVVTDPKFRPIPKKESKVKIDQRFGKMFTDKRFKIKATMDKRGRPVSTTSSEDLKRYYHLDESDKDDSDNEKASDEDGPTKETKQVEGKKAKQVQSKKRSDEGSESGSESEESEGELLDLARGEGNIETSEEDSSDSSDDEAAIYRAENEQEIEWDEMDKDAPRSEDTSRRLAVCNMDWHNLKAVDLFVLMASFAPDGGVVKSVSIYPSEFGKERLLEEAKRGPRLKARNEQALRKYEFERLRYYYAVVECDNATTANKIYESCDGMEYQTSGAKVDLRFIPDEMDFNESERTDFCDSSPDQYEPVDFINSALMLSKCESNWDGDDLRRRKALSKAYASDSKNKRQRAAGPKANDVDRMAEHLKTYIASDTDDESDGEKVDVDKYRKLLQLDEPTGDTMEEGDKEITFNPDLNAAVDRRRKEKNDSGKVQRTPFQEYLEKKKEKRREKRQLERAKKRRETTLSDDELPEGVEDDPFFKVARDSESDVEKGSDDEQEDAEEKRRQQLELLLMDEQDDGRKHFSLKKILKKEKAAKKNKVNDTDDFKVKVDDPRFAAIYTDHRFNIDPTDIGYRKTKAMDEIVTEKAKRRKLKSIE